MYRKQGSNDVRIVEKISAVSAGQGTNCTMHIVTQKTNIAHCDTEINETCLEIFVIPNEVAFMAKFFAYFITSRYCSIEITFHVLSTHLKT